MPHALLFSFLLSSSKDVLGQRTETAVRVKMRRKENTTNAALHFTPLLPPSPPSTHSHLHGPADATRDGAGKNGGDGARKRRRRTWGSR